MLRLAPYNQYFLSVGQDFNAQVVLDQILSLNNLLRKVAVTHDQKLQLLGRDLFA